MEQMISRLISLGYEPYEAEKLFNLYERQGDLDGLIDYIISKESINESLIEI